jgi:hypothetical protein
MTQNKLLRMDNVGIVVESLDRTISFFQEIGLKLEGRGMIEGEWAGRVTGLGDQSVEVAMLVTPDGHSRLELSQFIRPAVVSDHRAAPVNALCAQCLLLKTLMRWWQGLNKNMVPSWLVKWFSIKILTGFATFVQLMGCS